MKKNKIVLFTITAALVVSFQNCAKMNFTSTPESLNPSESANGNPVDASSTSDQNGNNNGNGNTNNNNGNSQTPPVVDIGNVATSKPFSCQTFTEMVYSPGTIVNIPKRDPNMGECFIVKIISKVTFPDSRSNPNIDTEVLTNNHNDNSKDHRPFSLGAAMVRLRLGGERAIKLSGGKNDSQKILVDNFLLIGIAPTSQIGDPQFYKAYGTSDSAVVTVPNVKDSVLFKDVAIKIAPFGTGGTSTIEPLSLQGQIETDKDYTLDVRALDAGGKGDVSDIYMLFQ